MRKGSSLLSHLTGLSCNSLQMFWIGGSIQPVKALWPSFVKKWMLTACTRWVSYRSQFSFRLSEGLLIFNSWKPTLLIFTFGWVIQVVPVLLKFIDNLTNIYVRFNRKRLKGRTGDDDSRVALSTLYFVSGLLLPSSFCSPSFQGYVCSFCLIPFLIAVDGILVIA